MWANCRAIYSGVVSSVCPGLTDSPPDRGSRAVSSRPTEAKPFNGRLGEKNSGIRRFPERLMGVYVIPLPNTINWPLFLLKVESWTDLVLAIRKEEPHFSARFSLK